MSKHPARAQSFDDDKADYNDLIDEYAAPYDRHSRHQSIPLESPSLADLPTHQRHHLSFSLSPTDDDCKHKDPSASSSVDLSYPPPPPTNEPDTRKLWQKIFPDSIYCRLYVLTVLVQTIIDLAIEGSLLIRFQHALEMGQLSGTNAASSRKMPVYLSIFGLAHVFQMVMAIDAVHARNTLQFLALTWFNLLFLVYAIIQIGEIRNTPQPGLSGPLSQIPISTLTTIIPCVISAAEVAYIALGWKIYQEFGWKVYKFLGADRKIKKMYAHFQIFECLIKFDVFFWVAFSVQFIWLVLQKSDWEYYLTVAALPLSLFLLLEGGLAARHESRMMMMTFIFGCICAMVYFIFKLVKVSINKNTPQYSQVWHSLTIFSVISIVLLVATLTYACIVMYNFGRGLKTQLRKKKDRSGAGLKRGRTEYVHRGPMSSHPNRMSID